MKLLKITDYDKKLLNTLEKYHQRQQQRNRERGITEEINSSININSLAVLYDWNKYKMLNTFWKLEQLKICELISENKVQFNSGADKSAVE